jgi:hypothetical protein
LTGSWNSLCVNASNFALGAMLSQNPDKTINRPIYYVGRLMNNVKENYTTTEKEVLAMIYAVKKFKHYSLKIFSHCL